jgi:hypothetical protein
MIRRANVVVKSDWAVPTGFTAGSAFHPVLTSGCVLASG